MSGPFRDLDLLFAAYPKGYLARPGVRTLGGWTCVEVKAAGTEDETHGWVRPDEHPEYGHVYGIHVLVPDRNVGRGDFLPALDPFADVATWACALADLATRLGHPPATLWQFSPSIRFEDLVWGEGSGADALKGWLAWRAWTSRPQFFGAAQGDLTDFWRVFSFDRPVKDPAEALVRALIQMEEGVTAPPREERPQPARDLRQFPRMLGMVCGECGGAVWRTPSGASCAQGHGGAEVTEAEWSQRSQQ